MLIGHFSPEAASKGEIGLIRDGDKIEISIPNRSINLLIDEDEMNSRREAEDQKENAWKPERDRQVSKALKVYASMVTSADTGAIRVVKD